MQADDRKSKASDQSRASLLRRGRWVEIASLVYNLIEVGVSLTAGFLTGSSALISWGMDSAVEAISAGSVIWRLRGEEQGISEARIRWRKKVTLTVLASAFAIAVCFILYEAISKFISQKMPDFTWWGIGILILSLAVNPVLAWGKYRYGKKLDAPVLRYDAIDTMICQYQTVVALVGLGLAEWMGWWWADPVAALLIVPYVAWEGWGAAKDAWKTDTDDPKDSDD